MTRKHPIFSSFGLLTRSVLSSGIFTALMLLPLALGLALKYGLPLLYAALPQAAVLRPYHALMDAFLLLLSPYMALFASALVSLEERDNGVCLALVTTPLGFWGYFISRFVLPALGAAVYAALIGCCFTLSARPLWHTAALGLPAAMVALSALFFIPAKARDKLSGMAMGKVCGLILCTVAVPFFLPLKWQPLLCWLPSYWFYRFCLSADWLMGALCVICAALWCWPLYRGFRRRVIGG